MGQARRPWPTKPTTAHALACVGVTSAETPAHLLLVMDLWDRSARSLLDDHRRTLKVKGRPGPALKASPPPVARHPAHIGFGPQVSDVLYILRDVATGLDVVHAHKARPNSFLRLALELRAI